FDLTQLITVSIPPLTRSKADTAKLATADAPDLIVFHAEVNALATDWAAAVTKATTAANAVWMAAHTANAAAFRVSKFFTMRTTTIIRAIMAATISRMGARATTSAIAMMDRATFKTRI